MSENTIGNQQITHSILYFIYKIKHPDLEFNRSIERVIAKLFTI